MIGDCPDRGGVTAVLLGEANLILLLFGFIATMGKMARRGA
jgi:hypothetical protein